MPEQYHSLYAIIVFLLTYALIMSEKIHRAVVALAGAMLVLFAGVIHFEEAIHHIDWNTIGLLVGMMIIVGITRRSGVFEYLAIWAAKRAKGEPMRILVTLAIITAVGSAFLDNVTTVLLVVPVTFSITRELNVNPIPFLITEIMASNIGGTATLIGDPPNIMISGPAGLSFMEFIYNLAPIAILVFIVTIFILRFVFRIEASEELKEKIMQFDEKQELKDIALMKKSLFVLAITIIGFGFHGALHIENSIIALTGATLLLLITREEPEEVLLTVEWPTIFFFIGLFAIVGALEVNGVIAAIAAKAIELTGGDLLKTGFLVLWLAAIASSFVDNIPFVATMIPMIKEMGPEGLNVFTNLDPIWWSLALGACLGGNGTIIGAAANVIVAGLADKNGTRISFLGYMKIAFPLMILSIVMCTVYLYFFYWT
ncbi:Na+/H+ antiporter NhaD/arsenite permease-like protein [Desulfohalotomaculum tongense]|uniref:SLC13 family permease n=1 Tax=Desulforadius tongensis TaxID=1216062 RepID=UPI0019583DA0|nr:ArsB/NhaD family transporter [Desulforadius tongensis]MBM7853991.1 Na+/H+ antiporter NhaD/arsenite permease-like protein [Desulforadius tongensis]